MDELSESPIISFVKSNLLFVVLGGLGLVLAAFGLYQLFVPHQSSEVVIQSESVATDVKGANDSDHVFVDIEGAVQKPGVYTLPSDKRLKDVVSAAGGLAKDANLVFVAKSLNMAAKIQDGMKVYVPFEGDNTPLRQGSEGQAASQGIGADGLINVNSASESELDTLPGIGPATAAKIISLRPYSTIDDLLAKKAVGLAVFSKIKEKIIAQ